MYRPLRRWFVEVRADERLNVTARDGLRLSMHRVRPRGPDPSRGAVLLLHGLASGSVGFHYPGRSLADHLAARGFDCYLPELRGHGTSERPPGFRWDLDDYLEHDIPAVLEAIQERSGHRRVHWIGHSMGGILLMFQGILRPDSPIASGQAIGSALDYRVGGTGFAALLKLRPLLDLAPSVPYGLAMHVLSPLLARLPDPASGFNFWHSNIEPEISRRLAASVFHSIPTSLLRSLSTTFDPGGFRTRDGSIRFLDEAHRFKVPIRLVAASRDKQVSVDAVRHTQTVLGGRAEVRVHGKEHGDADEYGHFDLIMGRRAPDEVWPGLLAWLEEHAEPSGASQD